MSLLPFRSGLRALNLTYCGELECDFLSTRDELVPLDLLCLALMMCFSDLRYSSGVLEFKPGTALLVVSNSYVPVFLRLELETESLNLLRQTATAPKSPNIILAYWSAIIAD